MQIETKKAQSFKASIIELFENEPKSIENFKSVASKWASELMAEIIAEAIKCKKYMPKDVIEVSVAVSIGEPSEEDDDNED